VSSAGWERIGRTRNRGNVRREKRGKSRSSTGLKRGVLASCGFYFIDAVGGFRTQKVKAMRPLRPLHTRFDLKNLWGERVLMKIDVIPPPGNTTVILSAAVSLPSITMGYLPKLVTGGRQSSAFHRLVAVRPRKKFRDTQAAAFALSVLGMPQCLEKELLPRGSGAKSVWIQGDAYTDRDRFRR